VQPTLGGVEIAGVQRAELCDARAGENERHEDRMPRHIVSTTRLRPTAPHLPLRTRPISTSLTPSSLASFAAH
jgi:hypothetical protein